MINFIFTKNANNHKNRNNFVCHYLRHNNQTILFFAGIIEDRTNVLFILIKKVAEKNADVEVVTELFMKKLHIHISLIYTWK